MFYFFHGTSLESFKNILKMGYINASIYFNPKEKKYLKSAHELKYVFTNIYIDGIPLREDEKGGFGEITFIITPFILIDKIAFFNKSWVGNINENTIIMNDNFDYIIDYLKKNYKYPYILTHEVLFKKRISMDYVIVIICENHNEKEVKKNLKKYGYEDIEIYDKFPHID
jgi:hypothetical protein